MYLGVCVHPVAVPDVHVTELDLQVGDLPDSLCHWNEVDMGGYYDNWRLGSPALNVFKPWTQALQSFLTIHDVPEEEIE